MQYNRAQKNVEEWKFILKYIDSYEFIIQSNGDLEASFTVADAEAISWENGIVARFRLKHGEYNPQNKLKNEVRKWLKKQLAASVIDTI